jgi:hypothetical protein
MTTYYPYYFLCSTNSNVHFAAINLHDRTYTSLDLDVLSQTVELEEEIEFTIMFPLSHAYTVRKRRDEIASTTLFGLLEFFREQYERVYSQEAEHATAEIQESCKRCPRNLAKIEDQLQFSKLTEDSICSICFDSRLSSKVVLECKHDFHFKCLSKWFERSNTCPLCKKAIKACSGCNSTDRTVRRTLTNFIPPFAASNGIRPLTNGPFGIYNYYFEQLEFSCLVVKGAQVYLIHVPLDS